MTPEVFSSYFNLDVQDLLITYAILLVLLSFSSLNKTLKVAIPFIYLTILHLFNSPTRPLLLDDYNYFMEVLSLYNFHGGALSNIFEADYYGMKRLSSFNHHYLFHYFAYSSFKLFGASYNSILCLNLILFFASYLTFEKITKILRLEKKWDIVFLLSPFIFIWNYFAVKDILVMLFNLLFIFFALKSERDKRFYLPMMILIYLSYYLRVYNIILYGLIYLWTLRKYINLKLTILISILFLFLSFNLFQRYFYQAFSIVDFHPLNPIRFIMTPLPWNTSLDYQFLFLPSILFMTSLPFIVLGATASLKEKSSSLCVVHIWTLSNIAFYSCLPAFLGPRQKLQISFSLIIYLIYGISCFIYLVKSRRLNNAA